MATKRTPLRRRVRGELSSDQEMALWLGCGRNGSFPFEDEAEAEELWTRHKARLMEAHACNGHRPMAWWAYDAPEGIEFDYDTERSTLFETGLLTKQEREQLIAEWRNEFERAQAPDFFYCAGPGKCLRGAPARAAHWQWADIPASLVREWTAESKAAAVAN